MTTNEISPERWDAFCERVSEGYRDARVSIELTETDGRTLTIADNVPLRRMSLDRESDGCNDNVVIEAGGPDQKPVRHVIVEPIHIQLRDGQNGRYNHLEVLAENGKTVVVFHPGITPESIRF